MMDHGPHTDFKNETNHTPEIARLITQQVHEVMYVLDVVL